MDKPTVGISSCLLGMRVRYDSSIRLDTMIAEELGNSVRLIACCPEAECGMTVPREPMDLYEVSGSIHLKTVKTGKDLTVKLSDWVDNRLSGLASEGLRGFVLKSGSPSCGIASARLHGEDGTQSNGTGIFAQALINRFPGMLTVEETDLTDAESIRSFINSVIRIEQEVARAES